MSNIIVSKQDDVIVTNNKFLRVYNLKRNYIFDEAELKSPLTRVILSSCEKYLILAFEDKTLQTWSFNWTLDPIFTRNLIRKSHVLVSTPITNQILVADKTGDIYLYTLLENTPGKLISGHCSMILDLVITPDEKFIISSTSDEKIVISNFPNAYNINSFCLGHKEFVNSLAFSKSCPQLLVSTSGDNFVGLWAFGSGKKLDMIEIKPDPTIPLAPAKRVFVTSHNIAVVVLFSSIVDEGTDGDIPIKSIELRSYKIADNKYTQPQSCIFPGCITDCYLDHNNHLWLLSHSADTPLEVYSIEADGTFYPILTDEKEKPRFEQINQLKTSFNNWGDYLKDCIEPNDDYNKLYKQFIDNEAAYLSKKKERQELKAKRQKKNEDE